VKQESLKHLADGATVFAVGTGGVTGSLKVLDFINAYAAGLGFLSSVVFGIAGLVFYKLSLNKQNLAQQNKKDLDDFKEETTREFKKVNTGIESILDKLSN